MKISPRTLLLLALLWVAMCLPLWLSRYPPMWDYTNHLLEAQVVAHYQDPAYDYARAYALRPGWFLASNALVTLLLVALGQFLPMPLAGRLLLSLDLALFVSGLWRLLRPRGSAWPLVCLAPLLAYNFTFTGGFLNFNLAIALGLHALASFATWQRESRSPRLLGLAVLLFLIYLAHLAVWALLVLAISALLAGDTFLVAHPRPEGLVLRDKKRNFLFWLALNSALPLILYTRPALALAGALIAPLVWVLTALVGRILKRTPLPPRVLMLALAALALLGAGLVKGFWPLVAARFPDVDYNSFNKLSFPFRLFALPNQYDPPNPSLGVYNLVLVILLLGLAGLLAWSASRYSGASSLPWMWAVVWLAGLYLLAPSRTHEISQIEPRVLLVAVLVALGATALPPAASQDPASVAPRRFSLSGTWLRRAILGWTTTLSLFSLAGLAAYTLDYRRQSRAWDAQLSRLAPQRSILVLNPPAGQSIDRPTLEKWVSTYHGGVLYSTTYTLEQGGFNSRTFDNGPVYPRPNFPLPLYYLSGFAYADFVQEQCPALREAYDAALFWGSPEPALERRLDACFGSRLSLANLSIWKK